MRTFRPNGCERARFDVKFDYCAAQYREITQRRTWKRIMFVKYTGLPDTAKEPSSGDGNLHEHAGRRTENDGMQDYYAQNGGGSRSGGSSRTRNAARRRKYRRRRLTLSALAVLLLALIVVTVVTIAKSCSDVSIEPVDPVTDAFRSEVYINGANVSGKTIDEARPQLLSNEEYAINNISIRLSGEGFSANISGLDIGAASNLDEVLVTALSGGAQKVYYTTISIDEGALAQRIDEINASLSSPPTDATFTIDFSSSGKPQFVYTEGKAGVGLDVAATTALVEQALAAGQYQTTITPALTTIEPTVSVDDLTQSTTQIGSFSTIYDFKGTSEDTDEQRYELIPNRAFNIEKAVAAINNSVIKPGRTWSFNDTVGDRNEKNGWKEANGIFGGDRFSKQYGGGVCQVSTTLYNALLECYPYVSFKRSAHSIPSTYVDKGLDATVDTGHIDFKVTNNSDSPLYIFAYVGENSKYKSRKRNIYIVIYGKALPADVSYRTRTKIVEETPPGEPVVTNDKTLYIGEEVVAAEARSKFVVDVFIDRYLGSTLQESIFLYTDTYEGNPERRKIGVKPTPTPEPTPTPDPNDQP